MRRVGALAATALLTGCPESCLIQRTRPLSTEPPAVLKPATPQAPIESAAPPAPQHPGKGTFGESIEFLGYDTEPANPRAGRPVVVTFYFHVLKPVSNDWMIFVHVDDRTGANQRINGDHYPASGQLHTPQWKAGSYVADRFVIDPPQSESKSQVDLWMGFYQGDTRLPISNPKDCVNDGNDRLLAGTLDLL